MKSGASNAAAQNARRCRRVAGEGFSPLAPVNLPPGLRLRGLGGFLNNERTLHV